MTGTAQFPVEPWCLRETHFDLAQIAQAESVFALSNGHIGLRGNLDEGEPHVLPGTYLNSFYEERPLPYAEAGYGYPEEGQTLVNVTNGKLIRLLVDDEPFDLRYGLIHSHERVLDMRTGLLHRATDWESPSGKRVRVRTTRLVSFAHRAVAAISYEVEAIDNDVRIIVQSELVANEEKPQISKDPRVAAALDKPLKFVARDEERHGAVLLHRTRASGLLMAAAMDHLVQCDGHYGEETDIRKDWARTTFATRLKAGAAIRIVKLLAYGWSSQRSEEAVRDQAAAALYSARFSGWHGLVDAQKTFLDDFWDVADVEVEGDPVLQQAVRFGLFHVLQAGARTERRAIGAKGLTGPGYDGHAFWDTEGFVLPVLTYTIPEAAADALRWRHSTLNLAKERAHTLGLEGAAFPWRTIRGQETSAYWPAGTAAFHLNATIAYAVERYRKVTGDLELEREIGLELLVETARLWRSLGHTAHDGYWHLAGVTGPDEYSAVADDNVFTNLMAARNLHAAADASDRHPDVAEALGVTGDEIAAWRLRAESVYLPYDERLGVHPNAEGYTNYAIWDFDSFLDRYPLMMHAPYVQLYRQQVLKQVDLVLALHWTPE
ncbi:MAG: putative glycosyl hydrolase, partial [Frankiales bacterium]|nr:putative glycosyl hydrolase [Frankiales bacterium]